MTGCKVCVQRFGATVCHYTDGYPKSGYEGWKERGAPPVGEANVGLGAGRGVGKVSSGRSSAIFFYVGIDGLGAGRGVLRVEMWGRVGYRVAGGLGGNENELGSYEGAGNGGILGPGSEGL